MKKFLVVALILATALSAYASSDVYDYIRKIIGIDYAHHEIHNGRSFCSAFNATLNAGQKTIFLVNTPAGNRKSHVIVRLRSSGESYVQVWKNPTVSNVGTSVEAANHNFGSNNTAGTIITRAPTITSAGAISNSLTQHVGNGQTTGGESGRMTEVVLDSGKLYLFNAVSEAASNDLTLGLDWYESDDYY